MNFRQTLLGFFTFGYLWTAACGLLVMLSFAPTAPAATSSIPLDVRTNPNANASKPVIDDFLKSQVADLSTPASVHEARESFINQVSSVAGQSPSASFMDLYAQELSAQLMPLLNNQDPSAQTVRLNVAIAVAGVAENTNSVRLLPITLKLLNDKSDAVLIWALRAAKYVLPPAIQINQQGPLLAAIKAQAGPNSNPMLLQLVYGALCPPLKDPATNAKVVAVAVPELQKLLDARVEQFRVGVPPDLLSVVPATNYLCTEAWPFSTAPMQLETMQILVNLAGVAGERADAANGLDKDQLISVVTHICDGLKAVAFNVNATTVYAALTQQLVVKPGMANVSAITSKIQATVAKFPAWANVTPPPHIVAGSGGGSGAGSGAATSAPAGAETTPAAGAK